MELSDKEIDSICPQKCILRYNLLLEAYVATSMSLNKFAQHTLNTSYQVQSYCRAVLYVHMYMTCRLLRSFTSIKAPDV